MWLVFAVVEEDPIKQGLNQLSYVVEEDPIKQGLKLPLVDEYGIISKSVVEEDPIKQGLKPGTPPVERRSEIGCRGRSNKTRIETSFPPPITCSASSL